MLLCVVLSRRARTSDAVRERRPAPLLRRLRSRPRCEGRWSRRAPGGGAARQRIGIGMARLPGSTGVLCPYIRKTWGKMMQLFFRAQGSGLRVQGSGSCCEFTLEDTESTEKAGPSALLTGFASAGMTIWFGGRVFSVPVFEVVPALLEVDADSHAEIDGGVFFAHSIF